MAEGKVSLVIAITSDLTTAINAVDFAKMAAITLSGQGGGGRPDMAQAGGTDPSAVSKIRNVLEQFLQEKVA